MSDPLLRAVLEDPLDKEALQVYADSLQERGDPRGLMIQEEALGKPLAASSLAVTLSDRGWKQLASLDPAIGSLLNVRGADLEELSRLPPFRQLHTLQLTGSLDGDDIGRLVSATVFPRMRELFIDHSPVTIDWLARIGASPLAVPSLELTLRASEAPPGEIVRVAGSLGRLALRWQLPGGWNGALTNPYLARPRQLVLSASVEPARIDALVTIIGQLPPIGKLKLELGRLPLNPDERRRLGDALARASIGAVQLPRGMNLS
jgi:uncharacterized protein (TIGR02996 family)